MLFRSVAASSIEQTTGIEQVNSAIVQMDEVTQQNAALVEQAAASSDLLREQATQLRELVSSFKVDGGQAAVAPPVPRHKPQLPLSAGKPAAVPRVAIAKPAATKPAAIAAARSAATPASATRKAGLAVSKPESALKRPEPDKTPPQADDKAAKASPVTLSDDDWEEF